MSDARPFEQQKIEAHLLDFNVIKLFFSSSLKLRKNKLVCLLTSIYLGQANICEQDQSLF
jgi:hypothetical protein